jgi:hypothetical protein
VDLVLVEAELVADQMVLVEAEATLVAELGHGLVVVLVADLLIMELTKSTLTLQTVALDILQSQDFNS